MKTVILNDTRSAEHVGCELVMENSLAQCRRVGIEIVGSWTTQDGKAPLVERLREAADFDSVLINGEGSMHHDRPVPTHLCEAARWAKEEGKKVVLYNSLWQENEALNRHLEVFDRIYCRDSVSAEAVRAAGASCQMVPDMIFASTFDKRDPPPDEALLNELSVIDSIDRKKSERLSKFAAYHGFPFLHMDRIGYERLVRKLFVRTGGYFPGANLVNDFVNVIGSGKRVLSGRFHGTGLAMVLGLPVVSVSSNTSKLEALHRDIGLADGLVLTKVPKRMAGLEKAFAAAEAARPAIATFVKRARLEIGEMFDEIARVFGEVSR